MATKAKTKKSKEVTLASISKKYAGSGVASEVLSDSELKIPSTVIYHNYQTGGGLSYGKMHEIYGEESSGKTLLALDYAYVTQELGGIVLFADGEGSFTKSWALTNGLDLSKIVLYSETRVEYISDWIKDMSKFWRAKLVNNEPILLITDSLAALDTILNIDSEQVDAKAEMGNRAKAIYKLCRIRNERLYELGITSIWINQLRKKVGVGMFEDPDTTPGGAAMKFYASIRMGLYSGKQIKAKIKGSEEVVGKFTSIRIKKNKTAPPRNSLKKVEIYFNPDYVRRVGFDRYHGLPEMLLKLEIVKKSKGSSNYTFKGKTLANGEDKFKQLLIDDDQLCNKLIRLSGVNTVSKTKKQLEDIKENLYKV